MIFGKKGGKENMNFKTINAIGSLVFVGLSMYHEYKGKDLNKANNCMLWAMFLLLCN